MTVPRINGPYSWVDLILSHRPDIKQTAVSDAELNEAWMARYQSKGKKAQSQPKTPTRALPSDGGLVIGWSPSMETPEGIIGHNDAHNAKLPTSPGLFASPSNNVFGVLGESDDELPSLSQLGVAFKSTPSQLPTVGEYEDFEIPTQMPTEIVDTPKSRDMNMAEMPVFVGFTTGSGKKLKSPSKEALKKAKELVNQVISQDDKVIGVSNVESPTVNQVIGQDDKVGAISDVEPSTPQLLGFQSASGKTLAVPSSGAMAKAEAMFENVRLDSPIADPSPLALKNKSMVPAKRLSEASITAAAEITPVKIQRNHRNREKKTPWRDYFKCPPCRDHELALLSGVPEEIVSLTSSQARDFCFSQSGHGSMPWDAVSAYEDLLAAGLSPSTLTYAWVQNHYRWIVWKLASLYRSYPVLSGLFSRERVLEELAARHEFEFVECQRPIIRKICERDDLPSHAMVLMVASCKPNSQDEVEVSDGWYSIWAKLDGPLADLLRRGRIYEGLKIVTVGAQLSMSDAVPVSEALGKPIRLYLSHNSTRRAPWYCKLGRQRSPAFLINPASINPQGGSVAGIQVLIERRFPLIYAQELPDGTRIVRTAAEHDRLVDAVDDLSASQQGRLQASRFQVSCKLRCRHINSGAAMNIVIRAPSEGELDALREGSTFRFLGLRCGGSSGTLYAPPRTRMIIPCADIAPVPVRVIQPLAIPFPELLDQPSIALSTHTPNAVSNRSLFFLSPLRPSPTAQPAVFCVNVAARFSAVLPSLRQGDRLYWRDLCFAYLDSRYGFPVYAVTEETSWSRKPDSIFYSNTQDEGMTPLAMKRALESIKDLL